MKMKNDFETLAILVAAAIAIYFATRRPKPSATQLSVPVLHGPGTRRPLHDVA